MAASGLFQQVAFALSAFQWCEQWPPVMNPSMFYGRDCGRDKNPPLPPLANDQTLQGIDMKKQSASEVRLLAESFGIRCGRLAWSEKSDHKG